MFLYIKISALLLSGEPYYNEKPELSGIDKNVYLCLCHWINCPK